MLPERLRKGLRSTAVVAAVVLASIVPARAQTSRVAGRVLDQTGSVLPGVTIDLVVGGKELTSITDRNGRYEFDNVPTGAAKLTFRLLNFSVLRRTVDVGNVDVATPDIVLALALNADVVVTAASTF